MHEEARRAWNPDYQQSRAAEALHLIRESSFSKAGEGLLSGPDAGLVEARILAFLGDVDAAEGKCEEVLSTWPSGAAWQLKLKLADRHSADVDPGYFPLDLFETAEGLLPPHLRKGIQQFKVWLDETNASDLASARTLLWCFRRE
jgi:hypothetical protein